MGTGIFGKVVAVAVGTGVAGIVSEAFRPMIGTTCARPSCSAR
jgi:hypothetical protein